MEKKITKYTSKVHGKIKRTTIYREHEDERELGIALADLLHERKNVVGCGFRGTYAYIDQVVR